MPLNEIDHSNIRLPKNINLADPEFHKPSSIDILIGSELFWQSLCIGQIKSCINHPTLQKTRFGWVVVGRSQQYHDIHNSFVKTFCTSSKCRTIITII